MILLVILLLLANQTNGNSPTNWTVPARVYGGGEYLCTCAKTAVSPEMMSLGPSSNRGSKSHFRHCKIDGSLERHRFICAYFFQFGVLDFLLQAVCHSSSSKCRALRVLHNAPEKAIAMGLNLYNSTSVDYIGFDFEVGPLVFNNGLNEFRADLTNLPFPSNFADLVITSHVLEHVPDMDKALHEIYRVLHPGRLAVIAAEVNSSLSITRERDTNKSYSPQELKAEFGQEDHVRMIGMDIRDKLRSVGFEVDPITTRAFYDKYFPNARDRHLNPEYLESYNDIGIFMAFKPSKVRKQPPYIDIEHG